MKNQIVANYYNNNVYDEWNRLENHWVEFLFTSKVMEKYIKNGDTILDIGGGPGRYSIYFAKKGCKVTLLDISEKEIEFAKNKSREENLNIDFVCSDCTDTYLKYKTFDHIFLMGPLYHLKDDELQKIALLKAIEHLKIGGLIYCSFITNLAGIIHDLKYGPGCFGKNSKQDCDLLVDNLLNGEDYKGKSFTECRFMSPKNILNFMQQFNLEKVKFFGQESIFAFNELQMKDFPKEEIDNWINAGEKILETPEVIFSSEFLMYIGMKKSESNE